MGVAGFVGFSLFWKVFVLLFGVFVDEVWRPACAGLRECTRVGYESALRCHVLPRWSGVDLDSVTVDGVESWLWSFDKAGAARKSWAVFRAVMRLAFRRGVTDNDVTRREIRLPRVRRYEPRVLTASEVRRLLRGFMAILLRHGCWCPYVRGCVGASWSGSNGLILICVAGLSLSGGRCSGYLVMRR